MKLHAVVVFLTLTCLFSAACSQSDQDKAKARAEELGRDTKREARKLGNDAKQAASEISDKTKSALDKAKMESAGPGESAEDKLQRGASDLKHAGERAGTKLENAAMTARVKAKLASEVGLRPAGEIDVDSSGSVVTLLGNVDSAEQKQAAEKAALTVDGVTRVANRLHVR